MSRAEQASQQAAEWLIAREDGPLSAADQASFDVVVTDVSDRDRSDRHATGRITLNVLGVPDAPGLGVEFNEAALQWQSPLVFDARAEEGRTIGAVA